MKEDIGRGEKWEEVVGKKIGRTASLKESRIGGKERKINRRKNTCRQ